MQSLYHAMNAPLFTEAERKYVLFHFGEKQGSFSTALWAAIAAADRQNRYKLEVSFPGEVAAYIAWTEGDLHERVTEAIKAVTTSRI